MKSLRRLFRYGPGPSSSHTIAPFFAAKSFRKSLDQEPDSVQVTFLGSLARTGKGHHSDQAVIRGMKGIPTTVIMDCETQVPHPLTMRFEASKNGKVFSSKTYCSLGGGELHSDDDESVNEKELYPFHSLKEILAFMKEHNLRTFREFCLRFEPQIMDTYLDRIVWRMFRSVENGLAKTGRIPANDNPILNVNRSAKDVYEKAMEIKNADKRRMMLLTAYAYAVAESSACGDNIVTSPTCGASGVLPAVLYYAHRHSRIPLVKIREALYAAGVIGNLVKENASIAGSVGGCQAEIGTASSMAAAALCSIFGLSPEDTEYAAEVAMEHFLGLSCDPVDGYVIIPCIERNAIGAIRAMTCFYFAKFIAPIRSHKVNFDDVVAAMKLTGDSLSADYKETALGGLALILQNKRC